MLFQMTDFPVDKSDFYSVAINHKNALGTNFPFEAFVLKDPIKLVPTELIPSFYMVNKYGDVYTETQYVLVPYIRFWIADPDILYYENTRNIDELSEINRIDYRQNPFHPYWVGGSGVFGPTNGNNPNKNAYDNLRRLMDIYVPPAGSNNSITNGYRNNKTPIPTLSGIGENIIPNEGGFKNGMFLPAGARYMQAANTGTSTTVINGHVLQIQLDLSTTNAVIQYRYGLSLPDTSTSATTPFILPPMFLDLFSLSSAAGFSNVSAFGAASNSKACVAVLTFGIQPA